MRRQHLPFEITGPHTNHRQQRSRAVWRRAAIVAACYAAAMALAMVLT